MILIFSFLLEIKHFFINLLINKSYYSLNAREGICSSESRSIKSSDSLDISQPNWPLQPVTGELNLFFFFLPLPKLQKYHIYRTFISILFMPLFLPPVKTSIYQVYFTCITYHTVSYFLARNQQFAIEIQTNI
jgi:hypothetical protein